MGSPMDNILSDIRTNTRDGAAHLARLALDALALAVQELPSETATQRRAIIDLVRRIHALRPAMGAIGVRI